MTAIAKAMREAGVVPARERLEQIAAECVRAHPRDWDAAREAFYADVQNDAALLWELFAQWRGVAAQPLLSAAMAAQRARQEPRRKPVVEGRGGQGRDDDRPDTASPPPSSAAGIAAIAAVTRRSLLNGFMVNGRPIGDVTPQEAIGWASSRERDARFVRLLTANLPLGVPIRQFRTDEDAERLYRQAQEATND